jgi:hypothetical protein
MDLLPVPQTQKTVSQTKQPGVTKRVTRGVKKPKESTTGVASAKDISPSLTSVKKATTAVPTVIPITKQPKVPTSIPRTQKPKQQDWATRELLKHLPKAPSNSEFYEEETGWRFHNPDFALDENDNLTVSRDASIPSLTPPTSHKLLKCIPPPPPLPTLPSTGFCAWSFDSDSRVLLANFRDPILAETTKGKVTIVHEDEVFLFKMMERDDITVISEGLADGINPSLWNKEYIRNCIGSEFHHKFRGFEKSSHKSFGGDVADDEDKEETVVQYEEMKNWYSMTVSDYYGYLDRRQLVQNSNVESTTYSFSDSNGNEQAIDVSKVVLYMVDVDMIKLLPQTYEDFRRNFKLPGILPGGSHCMMNAVNEGGRPFMGPNLYVTPPSSFTHFHQDGHGTVDSGHHCLEGYNEVVMLRRLTERHKHHALRLLNGTSISSHSTLYGLPHRDDQDTPLSWPTKDAISECKKMGYCPSVFVLKPGQTLHINKGRLHAFRKLAPSSLPRYDCHHDLRKIMLLEIGNDEIVCSSIAWDWMVSSLKFTSIFQLALHAPICYPPLCIL